MTRTLLQRQPPLAASWVSSCRGLFLAARSGKVISIGAQQVANLAVEGPRAGIERGDVRNPGLRRYLRIAPRLPGRDKRHTDGPPSIPTEGLRELLLVHLLPRPALFPESAQTSREGLTRILVIHRQTSVHLKFRTALYCTTGWDQLRCPSHTDLLHEQVYHHTCHCPA